MSQDGQKDIKSQNMEYVISHAKRYANDFPCLTGIPCGSHVTPTRFKF